MGRRKAFNEFEEYGKLFPPYKGKQQVITNEWKKVKLLNTTDLWMLFRRKKGWKDHQIKDGSENMKKDFPWVSVKKDLMSGSYFCKWGIILSILVKTSLFFIQTVFSVFFLHFLLFVYFYFSLVPYIVFFLYFMILKLWYCDVLENGKTVEFKMETEKSISGLYYCLIN